MRKIKGVMLSGKNFDGEMFFTTIGLDSDSVKDADTELVDIEMLRVGKFDHDVYGTLDITTEMLEHMVSNFEDNIVGHEISFDWNHKGENASAWLKDVRVEDGRLIGSVDFTEAGRESVEKKEFGYFSIEYVEDYKDAESGETFGPTILGGALTNKPFIKGLKKIEFEDKSQNISVYRLEESMGGKKKKTKKQTKASSNGLEQIIKERDELAKKVQKLENNANKSKELQDFIEAQKKVLDSITKKVTLLENENRRLNEKHKKSEERARIAEVEIECERLLTEEHHHPAVIEVVKQIMLSDSSKKVIKFSEEIKDENGKSVKREKELSISDAIKKVLEAIPRAQRADYSENTTSLSMTDLDKSELEKLEDKAIKKAFAKKGLKVVK